MLIAGLLQLELSSSLRLLQILQRKIVLSNFLAKLVQVFWAVSVPGRVS